MWTFGESGSWGWTATGCANTQQQRVYVVVKALWERCTARLTWLRETHGINSTNISGPAGGDETSPHVVTSLTNGWDGSSLRRGADVNRPPPRMVQMISAPMWWWVPNDLNKKTTNRRLGRPTCRVKSSILNHLNKSHNPIKITEKP